jgi:hypothetical protein
MRSPTSSRHRPNTWAFPDRLRNKSDDYKYRRPTPDVNEILRKNLGPLPAAENVEFGQLSGTLGRKCVRASANESANASVEGISDGKRECAVRAGRFTTKEDTKKKTKC